MKDFVIRQTIDISFTDDDVKFHPELFTSKERLTVFKKAKWTRERKGRYHCDLTNDIRVHVFSVGKTYRGCVSWKGYLERTPGSKTMSGVKNRALIFTANVMVEKYGNKEDTTRCPEDCNPSGACEGCLRR